MYLAEPAPLTPKHSVLSPEAANLSTRSSPGLSIVTSYTVQLLSVLRTSLFLALFRLALPCRHAPHQY